MPLAEKTQTEKLPYKVKDISLAEWGNIDWAISVNASSDRDPVPNDFT